MVSLDEGKAYVEGTPHVILKVPNIKKVYGVEACVYPHPINKLSITLVSAARTHQPS
jgi:ABC-type hemin transport system ATPase subunit